MRNIGGGLLMFGCLALACKEDGPIADSYCDVYVRLLRECGVIGEGSYEGCVNFGDAAEACEAQCYAQATCAEVIDERCGVNADVPSLTRCRLECTNNDPFQCENGSFVWKEFRCDGFPDCSDESDELNCTDEEAELADTSYCRNGEQLHSYAWCDGLYDCGDRSDDLHCLAAVFECTGDAPTVSAESEYCDGYQGCEDGSDEPPGCAKHILQCP